MDLTLRREPSVDGATIGKLFVDGRFFVWTCEDVIRPDGVKVQGQTCIPAGRYEIRITKSQRFGVMLPSVLNVPGFTGIRIHAGNGSENTDGCLLVGLERTENRVLHSRKALEALMTPLAVAQARQEPIWLTIHNPGAPEALSV